MPPSPRSISSLRPFCRPVVADPIGFLVARPWRHGDDDKDQRVRAGVAKMEGGSRRDALMVRLRRCRKWGLVMPHVAADVGEGEVGRIKDHMFDPLAVPGVGDVHQTVGSLDHRRIGVFARLILEHP